MSYENIGCIVCGSWEVERTHIKSRGSGGSDGEWNIILMDRRCHQEQHTIGLNRFAMKYSAFKKELERKGWEWDLTLLRWSHVRERSE
jgi:hypothetical protein